jgi:hypothetical protein
MPKQTTAKLSEHIRSIASSLTSANTTAFSTIAAGQVQLTPRQPQPLSTLHTSASSAAATPPESTDDPLEKAIETNIEQDLQCSHLGSHPFETIMKHSATVN